LAVLHKSSSGSKSRPRPSMLSRVFLQQHQLRLNLDLKAARGLEQAHEHHAQRNLLEGPVKVRLAHGADGRLQLVHPRLGRHPAGLDVEFRHAFVVTAEKCREVLRQVLFVVLGERAYDAEVERDIATKGLGSQADLDVAGVHVGMEKNRLGTLA